MESPSVLVVFYSRTGHTRRLARAIASATGADVEEIHDPTDRSGTLGYVRSGAEALTGVLAPIERPRRDPAAYDVVVVGGPVWATSVSSPVRTYLWFDREQLPAVAFFATLGGTGDARAFRQMKALVGRAPVATLAVREGRLRDGVPREDVARFVEALAATRRRRAHRRKLRVAG